MLTLTEYRVKVVYILLYEFIKSFQEFVSFLFIILYY